MSPARSRSRLRPGSAPSAGLTSSRGAAPVEAKTWPTERHNEGNDLRGGDTRGRRVRRDTRGNDRFADWHSERRSRDERRHPRRRGKRRRRDRRHAHSRGDAPIDQRRLTFCRSFPRRTSGRHLGLLILLIGRPKRAEERGHCDEQKQPDVHPCRSSVGQSVVSGLYDPAYPVRQFGFQWYRRLPSGSLSEAWKPEAARQLRPETSDFEGVSQRARSAERSVNSMAIRRRVRPAGARYNEGSCGRCTSRQPVFQGQASKVTPCRHYRSFLSLGRSTEACVRPVPRALRTEPWSWRPWPKGARASPAFWTARTRG